MLKTNPIRELANYLTQAIFYKPNNDFQDQIYELSQIILNEELENSSFPEEDLITLGERLHFFDQEKKEKLSQRLARLAEGFDDSPIFQTIKQKGWDKHWENYHQIIDLFPLSDRNEVLLHHLDELLLSLPDYEVITLIKDISDVQENGRLKFLQTYELCQMLPDRMNINDQTNFIKIIKSIYKKDEHKTPSKL